jgi:hypothetical protein
VILRFTTNLSVGFTNYAEGLVMPMVA